MADNGVVSILLVGHSFIRRLANYALSTESLNMGLSKGDCKITFVGRGGMTVPRLRGKAVEILTSCRPDVIFLEIGTNDISTADPLRLAADLFELAQWFIARGVRRVVISQKKFRVIANGRRDVRANTRLLPSKSNSGGIMECGVIGKAFWLTACILPARAIAGTSQCSRSPRRCCEQTGQTTRELQSAMWWPVTCVANKFGCVRSRMLLCVSPRQ